MKPKSKSNGLLRALRQMLPKAAVCLLHERSWHSLTFSGVQVCISAKVCNDEAVGIKTVLPEYLFDLPGQLVADLCVIQTMSGPDHSHILIDALVLDD